MSLHHSILNDAPKVTPVKVAPWVPHFVFRIKLKLRVLDQEGFFFASIMVHLALYMWQEVSSVLLKSQAGLGLGLGLLLFYIMFIGQTCSGCLSCHDRLQDLFKWLSGQWVGFFGLEA